MAVKRKDASGPWQPPVLMRWLVPPEAIRRKLILFVVAAALLIVLVWGAWSQFGARVLSDSTYRLAADAIEITPQPAWILGDVKAEVIRDGSLGTGQLTSLDPELTIKVARAFAVHPWIARVRRVSKYAPNRVVVQIDYRHPVAMVEVTIGAQSGLLPVDAEGTVLPSEGFTPEAAGKFPRITADESSPAGAVGMPWGDRRIVGAARLAAALFLDWERYDLHRIVAPKKERPHGDTARTRAVYELATRGGTRILWGRAPGEEVSGEATANEKLAALKAYTEQNGGFTRSDAPREIDVRTGRVLTTMPHTAGRQELPLR